MQKAAVVILNWNGRELLERFLPALSEHTPAETADIIVADNGSTDDSIAFLAAHYPQIRCIVFDKNYGFAEGYNRALSQLNYEYVVLLNSDVEVSARWLETALDYLDTHPDVIALQPKLLDYKDKTAFEYAGASGGFLDKYGYPFCRGRIYTTVEKDNGQYDEPAEVFWASGACLFIRLKDYMEADGFDNYFFAHQEEIDLCWRLKARGKKIVCLPQSVVYHIGGATLKMENPRKTFLNFRNNLLMVYKNLPEKYYRKTMIFRFLFDYLAALQFLLKGYPANAWAVCKARRDFSRQKKNYQLVRKENLERTVSELPSGMFTHSILWNYYIKNKKKYKQLPPNPLKGELKPPSGGWG
jgi:GT2 family glycosyltransferase